MNPDVLPPTPPRPFRLLVLEDLPELRLIVERLGKRAGMEVTGCADVPKAWEAIQNRKPDLVLLDQNLPGEHGLGLLRRFHGVPDLADLPVALFGHFELGEDLIRGLEAGARFLAAKELVTDPSAWRERLLDILNAPDGRPVQRSVAWQQQALMHPPSRWESLIYQALRQGPVRRLGAGVLTWVVRRAVQESTENESDPPPPALQEKTTLALVGGTTLPQEILGRLSVGRLVVCLADRLWCLLGAQDCSPSWTVLEPLVPGISGVMGRA